MNTGVLLSRGTGACFGAILLLASATHAKTPELRIWLKAGSPIEQQKKEQIERLAAQYDLKKYTMTREIIVDEWARSRSMPKLTLNGQWCLDNDDAALSIYLHEQGHWALNRYRGADLKGLFRDLEWAFPRVPVDPPQGAGGQRDSYQRLAVIVLEWQALEALIGPERARAVLELKQQATYTALYRAVLDHRALMEELLQRNRIRW